MEEEQAVYAEGLRALVEAQVPFLVGGGWALFHYLGRWRTTKDIDIFVKPEQVDVVLSALARAGFRTELTDPAWLGKAFRDGALIDVIFCSYNGLFPVDDSWLDNGRPANVLGVEVNVVGPEEIIVSKSFVAARDRFDGADVSWLIRATASTLDWGRIERLMRDHWEVLLWQLLHFLYVFPAGRSLVPRPLVKRLLQRMARDLHAEPPPACRGPMLDPKLYKREIDATGEDPRPRRELVLLTAEEA
jgi:Nucleotidyl transferase of unknown function (DUF2204)